MLSLSIGRHTLTWAKGPDQEIPNQKKMWDLLFVFFIYSANRGTF